MLLGISKPKDQGCIGMEGEQFAYAMFAKCLSNLVEKARLPAHYHRFRHYRGPQKNLIVLRKRLRRTASDLMS